MHRLGRIALATTITLTVAACSSDDTLDTVDTVDTTTGGTTVTTMADSGDTTSPGGVATSMPETTSSLALDDRLSQASDALRDGDFTTMLQLLQLSGLADELEGREVTILAPTEEAFTSVSGDELQDLIGDPSRIDDILQRHVIDELLSYDELAERTEVSTLSGDTLMVSSTNGNVTIDGAAVSDAVADAVSGESGQQVAVFGIDRVLFEG